MNKFIKQTNQWALYAIAFWFLPAGQFSLVVLGTMIEAPGIAMFFSSLFIDKASMYFVKIGVANAAFLAGVFSAGIGLLLCFVQAAATFAFRIMGKNNLATAFSVLFYLIGTTSYFNMLKISGSLLQNAGLLLAVVLLMLVPSVTIGVCSTHLAQTLSNQPWFKEMLDSVRSSKSASSRMFANLNDQNQRNAA